jgi:diacylglycerol kinase (ATP)
VTEIPFDRVLLIFNPNSTGDAAGTADQLRLTLEDRFPGLPVQLQPTARAGHARELAREGARHGRPLIISVSGDGGYNEVVNGIMDAANPAATAAVAAAGNANDHRRVTREHSIEDAVGLGHVVQMDLLRLTIENDGAPQTRYAHSYIGVGLTPVVAVELEKGGKGSLRELFTVVKTFLRFRPFAIELEDGERLVIDSLLFANLPEMAKVLKISENSDPDDGRFEVIVLEHRPRWRVLGTALRAATRGLGRQPATRDYRFRALKPMPLQIDGEVMELGRGDRVRVQIARKVLATIR